MDSYEFGLSTEHFPRTVAHCPGTLEGEFNPPSAVAH